MGSMREMADSIVSAFTNVFTFDVDPTLTERDAVEKCITETGVVAGLIACVQPIPIPLADLVVLTPLYLKMTLQIGKIKGFEVDQERGLDIIKEVMGVIGLATVGQTLIGLLGKVIPIAKIVFTFPLNYAATWAIGKVVDYYFDCMRDGTVPSAAVMKELFAEQFRIGKEQGKSYDQEEVQKQAGDMLSRADALRARVASRDPDLVTTTRLEPRNVTPAVASTLLGPAPESGERRKIKIIIKPRGEADSESAPAPELEPRAATKTIGGDAPSEIEIGFKPAEKTLGDGMESVGSPSVQEAEPEAEPEPEVGTDPGVGLVEQLERLGSLKEQGILTDEEFLQAKQSLLAGD